MKFSKSSVAPDVEVDVMGDIYHLDSLILRHCSAFFDKSLSSTWWKEENTHLGPDGIKYRYKLSHDDKEPAMSILEPVARNLAVPSSGSGRDASEGSRGITGESNDYDRDHSDNSDRNPATPGDLFDKTSPEWLRYNYNCMFRMFYHTPIDIPSDKPLGIVNVNDIIELAELYCATHAVAGQIKSLMADWVRLGGRIEDELLMIISMAAKIHSRSLFLDAFVHLVGQWAKYRHESDRLPDNICRLIDQEYMRVQEIKTEVDRKLGFFLSDAQYTFLRNALQQAFLSYQRDKLERNFYQCIANIRGDWAERNLIPLVNPLLVSNLLYNKSGFYTNLVCAQFPEDTNPWKEGEFEW